ncbi:serine hydrolase domain-containing protein [Acuticoccus sp.]|uniref:serine hydrolase domain-containing protein n=1 Tax=Acuticoccus sp. TaxID=1904378 RepID=UPI003B52E891
MRRFMLASGLALTLAVPAAADIEVTDPVTIGLDAQALEGVRSALEADVEEGRVPGALLLISRNGKVGFFAALGQQGPDDPTPMASDTIFRIYSMTKPIVSVAAMMLVEQGRLALDEPVATYIPPFAAMEVLQPAGATYVITEDKRRTAQTTMTVRDLLRHTSGMIYGIFDDGRFAELYAEAGVANDDITTDEFARRMGRLPLRFDPGTAWHYGRSTDVLGRVIEVATGMPLDQALDEMIFQPLGMTDTAFFQDPSQAERFAQPVTPLFDMADPMPMLSGGGGLTSTMEDYLRFVMMLRNRGSLDGVRIIRPETLAFMTENHIEGLDRSYFYPGDAYGFGLGFAVRIEEEGDYPGTVGDYWWRGLAGTYFWVDPRKDVFAIFLIQDPANRVYYTGQTREWVYGALAGD